MIKAFTLLCLAIGLSGCTNPSWEVTCYSGGKLVYKDTVTNNGFFVHDSQGNIVTLPPEGCLKVRK